MEKVKKYLAFVTVTGALATVGIVFAVTSQQVNWLGSATEYNAYSAGSYLFYMVMLIVSMALIVGLGYSVYVNLASIIKNKKVRQAVATLPVAFALASIMFLLGFAGFEILRAPNIIGGVSDFSAGVYALECVFYISYWVQFIVMGVYMVLFVWKDEKVRKFLEVTFCSLAILMLVKLWNIVTLFQIIFLDFYK